ncbi:MAG TPA: universal stress protein [Stellaceae bacterium]|jgi:nucleotide-binding universal stress UspA family protein|nr:universal stress protein [Stellaceae bacterium]
MPLKDLLVCTDPSANGDGRLKLAFNLARAHQAHLTGAVVLPEPQTAAARAPGFGSPAGMAAYSTDGATPGGAVDEVLHEADLADRIEQRFKEELRINGIDGEWHLLTADDTDTLIELAKTADLTILGQVSRENRPNGFRPQDVVTAIARPILVVPYAGNFETVGKHPLVAWDGTREAVRAVNDALPLLAGAEAVTVIFVGAQEASLERQRLSLDRVVRHLQLHGISATAEQTLQGGLAVSDVLLSRAMDLGADLIVAGAYHHSQLREALIGGVSRELLEHMTVPVLMSH